MNKVPNQLLRGATALFSIGAGVLHWDLWTNHGYRDTPARELIIAAAVIGVVVGLIAFVDRLRAGVPAVAANAVFLVAFALSRVAQLPTFHGGWSESGLAPDSAEFLGAPTTLILVVAEALAVIFGIASIVFGREPRATALPNEVVRPAY